MYVQITTKCNFKCSHCAYSASRRGRNMSKDVFMRALKFHSHCESLQACHPEPVTLGGGEPTLHPLFEEYLWEAIKVGCSAGNPFEAIGAYCVTNGTVKNRALLLANLARAGVVGASLSHDVWHQEQGYVDPEVVKAFTVQESYGMSASQHDLRSIRTGPSVLALGRARKLPGKHMLGDGARWKNVLVRECICDDLLVDPDGNVHTCGCPGAPVVGSVLGPVNKVLGALRELGIDRANADGDYSHHAMTLRSLGYTGPEVEYEEEGEFENAEADAG